MGVRVVKLTRNIIRKWHGSSIFGMGSKDAESSATPKADPFPNTNKWRRIFAYMCLPLIALCAINVLLNFEAKRPEFIPYEHMRLRTKRYPWGDGNHTLFHNRHYNALPGGYEDDIQEESEDPEEQEE